MTIYNDLMINYTIFENKPHMNFVLPDGALPEEVWWTCMISSLVAAASLVVYNLIEPKKSYAFIIVGFILVMAPACALLRTVRDEALSLPLSLFLELECCLIIICSFTAIDGVQKGNLIIIILNLITLALASTYPIVYMSVLSLSLTISQIRIYCFVFAGGMGVSALILFWYGFISSRGKPALNKIFCMQFSGICLLVGLSHFLFALAMEEISKGILYFMLITRSVFPLGCLGLSKEVKDNTNQAYIPL